MWPQATPSTPHRRSCNLPSAYLPTSPPCLPPSPPNRAGVDPKTVLCEFFRHGQCTKGFKCKFSHDPAVERKTQKADLFTDRRGREGGKEGGMEERERGCVNLHLLCFACILGSTAWRPETGSQGARCCPHHRNRCAACIRVLPACRRDGGEGDEGMEEWDQETLEKAIAREPASQARQHAIQRLTHLPAPLPAPAPAAAYRGCRQF